METENTEELNANSLHEKPKELLRRFKDMPRKAKVGMLAVGLVVVMITAFLGFALFPSGPSDALIKRVGEEHVLATMPDAGIYDAEGSWKIDSVDVMSKEKRDMEPFLTAQFGDTYYEVTCQVKASNGSAELERVLSCNLVMHEGEWQPLTDPDTESETWHAAVAPDEKKIGKNGIEALRMVDAANRSNELSMLYADCKASVEDLTFDEDEQTASGQLTFKREDSFSTAKAVVDAGWKFENGHWVLASAKANAGAAKVSHEKLVGTWKGAFKDTVADEGNCFGAQGKELILKISSVDDESGKVEGTFQGLAHYHAHLDTDANSVEGDADTGEIPFVATLNESESIGVNYAGMKTMTIGASFTAPETSSGKVHISFGSGTRDDANAALAKLTTKANAKKGYRSSSMFEDTYSLVKEQ